MSTNRVLGAPAANHRRGILTLPPRPGTLTATRLKVTTTLNGEELLAVPAPEGKPRITLRIRLPDRTLTAEIAAKSLRRAQAAIREDGADNIALVLQGHLIIDAIVEAGLAAQPRTTKPAAMTHPDNRS
jgi:hypothetical protein